MHSVDVVINGYGPVGQALAIMLAQAGHSVAVIDRKATPYPLPRAVCMDHEIRRILLAIGCGDVVEQCALPSPRYRWINAVGDELLSIDWTIESVSGGPEAYFFHQPSLEAALQARVVQTSGVDLRLGWTMTAAEQTGDGAIVTIRHEDGRTEERMAARFLIGADGANSFVRQAFGIGQQDLGFEADWLVVDVSAEREEHFGVKGAVQLCDPARPTTMVPGGICGGLLFRRWEFMRLPGEKREALEDPATVWRLLDRWVDRANVRLHKHIVYTFRSLVAEEWRRGRVLLAGDAAHVMPPFMGQGMCSGLRDAWNLAWKIKLVLAGRSADALLDSYQVERKDHVAAVIASSMALGRIICVADPDEAARRDRAFLDGTAPAPPPFPGIDHGIVSQDARFDRLAGTLAPHCDVVRGGGRMRLDDAAGRRFVLMTRDGAEVAALEAAIANSEALYGSVIVIGPDALPCGEHSFAAFLSTHGLNAMLMRPDFYVYGTARTGNPARDLLDAFEHDPAMCRITPAVGVGSRDNRDDDRN